MAKLNNGYFDAALVGFLKGINSGRKLPSVAGDRTAQAAAAVVFADAIDAAIPNDVLVSDVGGLQLDPSTALIAANSMWRPALLQSLCEATFEGRYDKSIVAADYAADVTLIVAAFNAQKGSLVVA